MNFININEEKLKKIFNELKTYLQRKRKYDENK